MELNITRENHLKKIIFLIKNTNLKNKNQIKKQIKN